MSERVNGTVTHPDNGTPPNLQLRDLLERAIFHLGVPAITLYPMGVLFYWIQIRSHYDISAEASWQAVFKIPQELLIAETAFCWWRTSFIILATPNLVLTAALTALTYVPITIGWRRARGTGWRTSPLRRLLALSALMFVILYLVFILYLVVSDLQRDDPLRRAAAVYQILTMAAALLAGYLIAKDRKKNRESHNSEMASIFVRRWLVRGALVAYTAAVIGLLYSGPPCRSSSPG